MSRWGPDARGPLEQAAVELCLERSFEQITVAEIAERAGFSERTFYRHFADKPEVLFGGVGYFQANVVNLVGAAPLSSAPLETVVSAFEHTGAVFQENAQRLRQRQGVIDSNPELQARELTKLAALAAAIAQALRQRGVTDPAALLASEVGTLIFRITFAGWIKGTAQQDWPSLFRKTLDDTALTLAGTASHLASQ